MAYWLFKTEPDAFSIDDLANRPEQTEPWDG
ncbi:MAG: EVE domain-containing protein, partial [Pseudomonadota bacterium]|nr:EVE domain-containing protein [Pseudomonadota bacterium]